MTAGDKLRLDVNAEPIASFKEIFDGQQSYSSIRQVQLPPANNFGPAVLAKYDQPGYAVSGLPDNKKLRGFRIADAEGNATDFFVDPATRVRDEISNSYNGLVFGTENLKFNEIEGVLIPVNFTQRFEMKSGAFFANYKVKDIKINQPIGDDVFAIH